MCVCVCVCVCVYVYLKRERYIILNEAAFWCVVSEGCFMPQFAQHGSQGRSQSVTWARLDVSETELGFWLWDQQKAKPSHPQHFRGLQLRSHSGPSGFVLGGGLEVVEGLRLHLHHEHILSYFLLAGSSSSRAYTLLQNHQTPGLLLPPSCLQLREQLSPWGGEKARFVLGLGTLVLALRPGQ